MLRVISIDVFEVVGDRPVRRARVAALVQAHTAPESAAAIGRSYALNWTNAATSALGHQIVPHMFRIIERRAGRPVATLTSASAY
jgi:hypothetical protein